MDAIILEQAGLVIDALEPERDQLSIVFTRKIAIKSVERRLEFRPVIGGAAHPHDQHGDVAAPKFAEHGGEIGARLVR